MHGVFKKITLGIIGSLLLCSFALAIDNEYKNSLVRIELSKKDANSYNIDLVTQKKYAEPVKVIKKNDLNYYILLPETKNTASDLNSALQDIKSITTSSFNYANQDKNGYTKVNINTSKPINFNINVKSLSQIRAQNKAIAAKAQTNKIAAVSSSASSIKSAEVQKKNSSADNVKKTAPKAAIVPAEAKVNKKVSKINNEISKKIAPKEQKTSLAAKNISKTTKTQEKTTVQNKSAVEPEVIEEISKATEEEIQKEIEKNAQTAPKEETINEVPEELAQAVQSANLQKSNLISLDEAKKVLKKVKNLVLTKGITAKKIIKCAILAVFVLLAIVLFIASILAIIFNRKKRINRINDSLGLSAFKRDNQNTLEEKKQNANGQYFVFDKNISQNFYNPDENVPKKHYELSTYEPDIQINYEKGSKNTNLKDYSSRSNKNENEYDIIQRILKEDSLIEFERDELNRIENQTPAAPPVSAPSKKIQSKPKQKEKPKVISEPVVLSSVEIAPERGFMCVSYNDNINLLGYIFDDVYALHSFNCQKLENYDIKFRLSEKDEKGANFIVRVDGTKMLVRVTKSFMTLEVLM